MFSKTSLNVLVLVHLNCFQKMVYIVAKPLVVFFSQMGCTGSVKFHNVFHLDITKLAILRFKIQAGELADCWRVEVHIRLLPLPIGQTINAPENEQSHPDPLIYVPDPCFCRGQTSSQLATVHVVHRFKSGNLQMFSWVVTNGFFLGWILQTFYL
jgi:hypothetical protein